MSYLLVVLIVFIALSPLISMMPSRRQRQIADLRQAAASAGLYVQLKPLPGKSADDGKTAYYGCRRQRGDAGGPVAAGYSREVDGWVARGGGWPAETLALLAELPAGVADISADVTGIGVFWDERGDQEDVRKIAGVLLKMLGRTR